MDANKIKGEAKNIILNNGVEITYCERGENNSDVIICGAFFFHTFMPVVEKLAEKYHVYGVIMRFDGKGDELNSDGSINWARQWGKDIYNFAQAMNLNQFHYVGKCHGTVPGWYLVKNHPEVLKTFACYFLTPHVCKQNDNQWFNLLTGGDPSAMMRAAMRKPETGMKIKMEEMASVGKIDVTIVPTYAANFTEHIWQSKEDCIETLKNMTIPIEYLFGTEDLFFKDHFDSSIFAIMNTKDAKTVILGGERHLMEIDCPEKIAEEILNFIDNVN
ncbi:MAG: alpha/beta hydrolase [Selenomonadaceae bacterium]|nr:alpha/beta hydrolase [Selenomonadaceae bacterium]